MTFGKKLQTRGDLEQRIHLGELEKEKSLQAGSPQSNTDSPVFLAPPPAVIFLEEKKEQEVTETAQSTVSSSGRPASFGVKSLSKESNGSVGPSQINQPLGHVSISDPIPPPVSEPVSEPPLAVPASISRPAPVCEDKAAPPAPRAFGSRPSLIKPPEARSALTSDEKLAMKQSFEKEDQRANVQQAKASLGASGKSFGSASTEQSGSSAESSKGVSSFSLDSGYRHRLIVKSGGLPKKLEALIDRIGYFLGYTPQKIQQEKEKQMLISSHQQVLYQEKLELFVKNKIKPLQEEAFQSLPDAIRAYPGKVVYVVLKRGEKTIQVLDEKNPEWALVKSLNGSYVEEVLSSYTPFDSPEIIFGKSEQSIEVMEEWSQDAPRSAELPRPLL